MTPHDPRGFDAGVPGMSEEYGPYGFDPDIDTRDASQFPSAYRAVDFKDGRFGVFLVHRSTRVWWRLIAVFSTWERAERYAGVENDCMDGNFNAVDFKPIIPLEPINDVGTEEISPAPETLPPEPPTNIQSPLQAEGSPYAKLWTRDYSQTLPLSDRVCERPECGYRIPTKRAKHKLTKYCSPECAEIVTKERALAKKTAAPEAEPEPPATEDEIPTPDAPAPAEEAAPPSEGDTWTDDRVTTLRALVAEGLSYSEIGSRLGVTKNAALGKANRLGISPPAYKEPESAGTDQDEIARFIAERGVTKLPPDPRLEPKP